jgi:hypothetical protein
MNEPGEAVPSSALPNPAPICRGVSSNMDRGAAPTLVLAVLLGDLGWLLLGLSLFYRWRPW